MPYRKRNGAWEFFLQMRGVDAETNPNRFGVFGGGIEGNKTPQQALLRELKEELTYIPRNYRYFSRFENANRTSDLFIEEVGEDFEKDITVCEGQYGKFLTADEVDSLGKDRMTPMVRVIILQLRDYLAKK